MNPDIKSKWVAALRSDNYKQGKEWLRQDDSFCCLGVLCDLHKKETGSADWYESGDSSDYLRADTYLPSAVAAWAGLDGVDRSDPCIHKTSLSTHNDNGATFHAIADLIERHL